MYIKVDPDGSEANIVTVGSKVSIEGHTYRVIRGSLMTTNRGHATLEMELERARKPIPKSKRHTYWKRRI